MPASGRSRLSYWSLPFAFFVALSLAVAPAGAQGTVAISGVVTDPDGLPIYGALVSLPGTGQETRSDERGEFRFFGLQRGGLDIAVRRLGFAPASVFVNLESGVAPERIRVVLTALPALLDQVTVRRERRMRYTGRLAGYYQRLEQRSGGQFITRDEIDRDEARSLSQLLSSSPGVSRVALRTGGAAVRMRGRSCRPLVWIDGVPMPTAEVDLDAFPVHTLHGVEMYLGGANAPIEYQAQNNRSSCGSIMLWSRGRDTEGPKTPNRPIVDLERLVRSMSVYTADQVDQRAELRNQERLQAAYPPELYASKISGSITTEFVVDATGRIEPETFTVVSATHRLLATAVAKAILESTFTPAKKDGKTVRQFVRHKFDFDPRVGLSTSR